MNIIADSGSTKCDWVILHQGGKKTLSTRGLNPLFLSREEMAATVLENEALLSVKDEIERIYFYGAGCANPELNSKIAGVLQHVFQQAKITVDSDLKACALATYDNKPAISCILGTGSNSCYFDGKTLSQQLPAIGYILGDEAGGAYFGKKLLSAFLYRQLPQQLSKELESRFELSKSKIIDQVYRQPDANVYLASFVQFLAEHAQDSYVKAMIYEGFKHFLSVHVCAYPDYRKTDVNFIGSIAFVFREELHKAAKELDIKIGRIIQKPIDRLVEYHLNYLT